MSRTALVTGAGSGIGRGVALALARRGFDLVLAGRRVERLREVALEIERLGARATCVPTDLCSRTARAELVARVLASTSDVALLVHAAATSLPGEIATRTSAEIEDAVTLNVAAPLDLTARLLPALSSARGTVALVGSAAAFAPQPYFAAYGATKAAIASLAESLHHELAPRGVRVVLVVPPVTATAMTEGLAESAGVPAFPRADAERTGERVVRAIESGRPVWIGSWSDRVLASARRFAPGALRVLLRSQRERFARMARAASEGR